MAKKIAVIGSRGFQDKELVFRHLSKLLQEGDIVVSGGAKGPDSFAEEFCEEFGFAIEKFLPDWNLHGKAAGFIRNGKIIEAADEVIAFWDGQSRGTMDSVKKARKKGIPITIIPRVGQR